jgi:hypothetical protein
VLSQKGTLKRLKEQVPEGTKMYREMPQALRCPAKRGIRRTVELDRVPASQLTKGKPSIQRSLSDTLSSG